MCPTSCCLLQTRCRSCQREPNSDTMRRQTRVTARGPRETDQKDRANDAIARSRRRPGQLLTAKRMSKHIGQRLDGARGKVERASKRLESAKAAVKLALETETQAQKEVEVFKRQLGNKEQEARMTHRASDVSAGIDTISAIFTQLEKSVAPAEHMATRMFAALAQLSGALDQTKDLPSDNHLEAELNPSKTTSSSKR